MALPKIALPTYTTELPLSKKKVNFRPYLVKEDKILLMAAQGSDLKEISMATAQVINACVQDEGFDVKNESSVDADFLFLNIRAKSVGESVDVGVTCNHKGEDGKECGTSFQVPLTITDLKMVDANKDKRKDTIKISNDVKIVMKPTTFQATIDADMKADEVTNNINIIYNSIEHIMDKDEIMTRKDFTKDEFKTWMEELDNSTFNKMIDYINNLPVLQLQKKTNCPKCGFEHELNFEDTMSFF